MSDRHTNGAGNAEPLYADIDAATRRLMMALDALEAATERRRDADRDENDRGEPDPGARRSRLARRLADALERPMAKTRR